MKEIQVIFSKQAEIVFSELEKSMQKLTNL